jgi:hypothetical protein
VRLNALRRNSVQFNHEFPPSLVYSSRTSPFDAMNELQRFFAAHQIPPDRDIRENLGSQVDSISTRNIEASRDMAPVKTEEVKQVSSYNWIESVTDKPTIMVPGSIPVDLI